MIWTGTILTVDVAGATAAAAVVAAPVAALGVVAGVWAAAASEKIKTINYALNVAVHHLKLPGCLACEAAC